MSGSGRPLKQPVQGRCAARLLNSRGWILPTMPLRKTRTNRVKIAEPANGQAHASVLTLYRIAEVLNVPFSALFEVPEGSDGRLIFPRSGSGRTVRDPGQHSGERRCRDGKQKRLKNVADVSPAAHPACRISSIFEAGWCCERGLNSRPLHYQWSALPLSYRSNLDGATCDTGRGRWQDPAARHDAGRLCPVHAAKSTAGGGKNCHRCG